MWWVIFSCNETMATTAAKTITITLTGDVAGTQTFSPASNTTSAAKIDIVSLSTGANTITVPSVTGFTVTGVVIAPPAANTNLITIKGVSGDTGVALHKTDPSYIALDSSVATFVLNAAATINGVRLEWS